MHTRSIIARGSRIRWKLRSLRKAARVTRTLPLLALPHLRPPSLHLGETEPEDIPALLQLHIPDLSTSSSNPSGTRTQTHSDKF